MEIVSLSPTCSVPAELPTLIEQQLSAPEQKDFAVKRCSHLKKWCGGTQGTAVTRIAELISARLETQQEPDWCQLRFSDRRKGLKLKALRFLGKPYNYKPLVPIRGKILGGKYKIKAYIQEKSITPADARGAVEFLESKLGPV
jgi:hypothetical protein